MSALGDLRAQSLPEVGLQGAGVHPLSKVECVDYVLAQMEAGRGGWLLAADLDYLIRTKRDPEFQRLCEESTLRVAAGNLLRVACRLQRTPLPERVAVHELMHELASECVERGRSVFVVAPSEDVLERSLAVLRENHPGLEIEGIAYESQHVEGNPLGVAEVSRRIIAAEPDFVFLGLDSPVQEKLIRFLRHDRDEAWWIGAGDNLRILSGNLTQPARWMRGPALEWMHWLAQEPMRNTRRYLIQGLPFGFLLLTTCAVRGMMPKGKTEGPYGKRMPRALLVDDDKQALDHLEILLSSRFPDLEIETRTTPDISGSFDFYFLDNDFEGKRIAAELAGRVRKARPKAVIIAFSGLLDLDTLKSLINVGCDGVCDKQEPQSWRPILELVDRRLNLIVERHRAGRHAFGGVRRAAHSIQHLLREWNERERRGAAAPAASGSERDGESRRSAPSAESARTPGAPGDTDAAGAARVEV